MSSIGKYKLNRTIYADDDCLTVNNVIENGKSIYELYAKKGEIFYGYDVEECREELENEIGNINSGVAYVYANKNFTKCVMTEDMSDWFDAVEEK